MRTQTVMASRVPIYQLGFVSDPRPRHMYRPSPTLIAPQIPLYQLGSLAADPAKIIGVAAPVAAKGTTAALTAFTSISSAAVPLIGAAVAVLVTVIAGLWAAHEARAKGAREENTIVNSVVSTFDNALRAIFAAANSSDPAQQIPASEAISQCQQLLATCWQKLAAVRGLPGVADNSGGGANCGTYTPGVTTPCSPGHPCGKSCTAGCCVGCNDFWPSILDAIAVFSNPNGGTVNVCTVYGSKYGASQRGGYSLTYKPPASAVSSIESALTGASGGSLIPLLAIGALAFFALK
jgi:hypothetical protein